MNFTEKLDKRRQELGMTFEALSKRSGVPISTIKSIFKKGVKHATFANVSTIAEALGVEIDISVELDSYDLMHQQAVKKARELVGLVQGTSALESQGVSESQIETMVQRLVHTLMAGSPRKLWA
ncbi:MAG: helix-turn-helix transcriptional regulator [Pirellulaceae bacterium]